MGIKIDGFVGTMPMADGSNQSALLRYGRDGSLIMQESHGKYFEQALRGNIFTASSDGAGVSIPVAASATATPYLWNPYASGVIFEVIRLTMAQATGTPMTVGAIGWYGQLNAGQMLGTAAGFSVFTNIAVRNNLLASGKVSQARFSIVNTATVAPVHLWSAGYSTDAWTAASTYPPWPLIVDYDGQMVVPPGVAIGLQSTIATATLFVVSITYIENVYPQSGIMQG
jgi:hypothetical protein